MLLVFIIMFVIYMHKTRPQATFAACRNLILAPALDLDLWVGATKVGYNLLTSIKTKEYFQKYFVGKKNLHTYALPYVKNGQFGRFVYRLGLKIFILARGVRFPYRLQEI